MKTVIFRTIAPTLAAIMIVFSVFVLLRGHNEPGGGFIGGLIAASAIAIYGIAVGVEQVRRAMRVHPISLAGFGVFIAALAGMVSMGNQLPFLTGLSGYIPIAGVKISITTVMVFDIGVYFVVVGAISAIALALEEGDENSDD